MQTVTLPKEKNTVHSIKQDTGKIRYFSLQDTLPAGHILAFNTFSGTLSYLCHRKGEQMPLMMQQQFTFSEMSLLLPLLEAYPHYCPHEVIFAHFYNGDVTELVVSSYRQRLQDALDAGTWDQEMRPLRNVLSRVRLKARPFGLNITSILETGYMLMVTSPSKRMGKA
ncbi:MAG TPA: hypothetical protein VJ761_19990 [Ktedonobacteraceae bacterium]|nr:hypothetical protein [Ktedonobacteraceae bacterium]